jgi:S-adenosyl methyltransferase
VQATLDLDQPVALMLMAIMHFMVDDDDPYTIVAQLMGALPAGSFLAMSHFTSDFLPAALAEKLTAAWERNPNNGQGRARSAEELGRFFAGLDLVPPGIAPLSEWRAENEPQPRPARTDVSGYGAIGRKP